MICLGLPHGQPVRCQAPESVPRTLFVLLFRSVLVLLDIQDVSRYEERRWILRGLCRVLDSGIEAFLIPAFNAGEKTLRLLLLYVYRALTGVMTQMLDRRHFTYRISLGY